MHFLSVLFSSSSVLLFLLGIMERNRSSPKHEAPLTVLFQIRRVNVDDLQECTRLPQTVT